MGAVISSERARERVAALPRPRFDLTGYDAQSVALAKAVDWGERQKPETYFPAQLHGPLPHGWCDWWSVRSQTCCCCFPCLNACASWNEPVQEIDVTDHTIWQKALERPAPNVPEQLKGVWWL
jgi:hypothetical protein